MRAAGKADDEDAPLRSDTLQGLIEQGSADRIEHDIGAAPAAKLLQLPAEIVAAMNQPGGGTVADCQIDALLASGNRDYARACSLSERNRGEPDAAGGAEHDERSLRAASAHANAARHRRCRSSTAR